MSEVLFDEQHHLWTVTKADDVANFSEIIDTQLRVAMENAHDHGHFECNFSCLQMFSHLGAGPTWSNFRKED